jgi:DNA-binding LacI/PurR family transcriptional regulator
VATAAGVSTTTVSHALNGKGVVNPQTVDLIRKVALEINYRPNAIARGLRASEFGLIGLVFRPISSLGTFVPEGVDYFLRIAGFASLTAMENRQTLMLVDDLSKDNQPLSARAADGYIVVEPFQNDPVLTLLEREGVPFLTIGEDIARRGRYPNIDTRVSDQVHQVLNHLKSSGASTVALVTGTDQNAWNEESLKAYNNWCYLHEQAPMWVAANEADGEAGGQYAFQKLWEREAPHRPDAVFCLMGRQASGIVQAAQSAKVSVPESLLVAAGSGTVQNQNSSPSVTALDLQPEVIGQRAVEAMLSILSDEPVNPENLRVPDAHLILRQSTQRESL